MAMQRPEVEARSVWSEDKKEASVTEAVSLGGGQGHNPGGQKPLMGGLSRKSDNLINVDKAHSGSFMKKRWWEGMQRTS